MTITHVLIAVGVLVLIALVLLVYGLCCIASDEWDLQGGPELSTDDLDHAGMGVSVRMPGESDEDRDARVARDAAERRRP